MTSYIGSNMSLRFVVREVDAPVPNGEPYTYKRTERILQYGLRPVNSMSVEWFDVPTETESGEQTGSVK